LEFILTKLGFKFVKPKNEDEKWSRLFEQLSPIYKWNPGGLISA
jgi:hypothetical protein